MVHPLNKLGFSEPEATPVDFRHRCVRDLAWVVASPPIISGSINGVTWFNAADCLHAWQRCLPQLIELERDPSPLLHHLSKLPTRRLGFYFEALVAFWLKIDARYHLLAANLPLHAKHQTLGELDYIMEDLDSGEVIHLEVAVKFYLCKGSVNNMADWWGARNRDQLAAKFKHLTTRQTQLSVLYPEHVPFPVTRRACLLKGRLFYPATEETRCSFTDHDHLHGHWQTLSQFREVHNKAHVLGKRDWLTPPATLAPATELKPLELPQQVLISPSQAMNNPDYWFVLPD